MNTAPIASALAAFDRADFPGVEHLWQTLGPAQRDHPALQLIRALALGGAGQLTRAGWLLDRLVQPGHAHPRRDLGDLLARLGRHAEAAAQYRAATESLPDDVAAWHALGLSLAELGELPEAAQAFHHVIALDPAPAAPWSNLGMILKTERRFQEAITVHNQAVARAPTNPRIRVNRAVALLHAGRLTEAWADYEHRLLLADRPSAPPGPLLPQIAGADLSGRTVLVWHEEGFGDTIQFSRYIPMLAGLGARVLLAVPPPLTRLMRTLAGATVLEPGAAFPPYDYHCPVFSLPRAFATTLDTIPDRTPYLSADPALAADWAARLPPGPLRVGCAWAGQSRPWLLGFQTLNARRNIDPADLRPIAGLPGLTLISLQFGQPAPEFMFNPMEQVTDFADTAAIVANLDLIVSVDTSVIHLAGALDKPVLLLDRYDNCWRWFSGREDSPWYPKLRILRQHRINDWSGPLRRLLEELAAGQGRGPATATRQSCPAPTLSPAHSQANGGTA